MYLVIPRLAAVTTCSRMTSKTRPEVFTERDGGLRLTMSPERFLGSFNVNFIVIDPIRNDILWYIEYKR